MKRVCISFVVWFLIAGCTQSSLYIRPGRGIYDSHLIVPTQIYFTARFIPQSSGIPTPACTEAEISAAPFCSRELQQAPFFQTASIGAYRKAAVSGNQSSEDQEDENDMDEHVETTIADPMEKFNRAMFQFNDRLYFWILKPAAEGYKTVIPEPARAGVSRFFDNIKFPIRFVSNLLQLNFEGAFSELGRFTVNTVWGIGGLLDPASTEDVAITKYDADLGQTLGMYGFGPGFYIVWPVLGPSSARDSVQLAGEYFLDPVSYLNPLYASFGVRAYNIVNDTSLRIGDYESLKEAAIDPYVSMRNAYVQYREGKIKGEKSGTEPPKPAGVK